MPWKKFAELPKKCQDPEHNPPTHVNLEPGFYTYECPTCKKKEMFRINGTSMQRMPLVVR